MFVRWLGFTASSGELRATIGLWSWLTSTSLLATLSSVPFDEPPPHAPSSSASPMVAAEMLAFAVCRLMRPPRPSLPPCGRTVIKRLYGGRNCRVCAGRPGDLRLPFEARARVGRARGRDDDVRDPPGDRHRPGGQQPAVLRGLRT